MKINMQLFCHPGGLKYDLKSPFVHGGYLCATDGRILVRVKTNLLNDTEKRLPDIKSILELYDFVAEKPESLTTPCSELILCPECLSSGRKQKTCPTCDGGGMCYCTACDNYNNCDTCDGNGTVRSNVGEICENCQGTCKVKEYGNTEVLGILLAGDYIAKILENLPNPKVVACGKPNREKGDAGSIKFVFDGGDGVLMGLLKM